MITQKKIIAAANEINWQCDIQKNDKFDFKKYYKKWSISFNCYTRFGQEVNVNFQINTLDNLSLKIYDYWQNYDPDQEAILWTDFSGHGKNGAPYRLKDIITDIEEVESKLEELYHAINKFE